MKTRHNKKPTRSHTFGGCGTCRKRHVKCDKVRPTCLTCRAIGAVCDGFSQGLKWVDSSGKHTDKSSNDDSAGQRVRQHLYTEASRASMSTALRSVLAERPVDESLSELDALCKDLPSTSADGLAVGPFRVFSFDEPDPVELASDGSPQPVIGAPCADHPAENALPSVESIGTMSDMHDFLDWPDLFDLDFVDTDAMSLGFDYSLEGFQQQLPFGQDATSVQSVRGATMQPQANINPAGNETHTAPPSTDVRTRNIDPAEAQLLLKHFKDHVIPHMRVMPMEKKSTWEIINLDCAMITLARLTYMITQPVSYAALANLRALLALSAKHLAAQPDEQRGAISTEYWQDLAGSIAEEAKQDLKCSLRDETSGRNAAKYKEQLMALIAVLAFATLSDRQEHARAYIVDAERLLRTRGLAKANISRKARELHHAYTWARIIEESTYVLHNYEDMELNPALGVRSLPSRESRREENASIRKETAPQSGHNTRLDDFLHLEQPFSESDPEAPTQKDNEVGLHDIHLEDSRHYAGTMYKKLYGISETWLCLVSQTTRLANVMDSLDANKDRRHVDLLELLDRRKQRLENMVCSFAAVDRSITQQADFAGNGADCGSPRDHTLRALNAALVIFFYRRIRKVNPWILQEHVNNVIQALKDFDESCQNANVESIGTPWPAFIAACEALVPAQKEYFSAWFDRCFAATGFARLQTARLCVEEVWRCRDGSVTGEDKRLRDSVSTWEHISKEQNLHVLLS